MCRQKGFIYDGRTFCPFDPILKILVFSKCINARCDYNISNSWSNKCSSEKERLCANNNRILNYIFTIDYRFSRNLHHCYYGKRLQPATKVLRNCGRMDKAPRVLLPSIYSTLLRKFINDKKTLPLQCHHVNI
jgi:hypothetical protein